MSSFFRRRQGTPAPPSSGSSSCGSNGSSLPGPQKPVTLYLIRLSPPCRAVWLYLAQNKIQHTLVDVDPGTELDATGRRPGIPSNIAHQDVPILVDGEVVVFEGPAILSYLSTRYTNHAGYGQTLADRMMTTSVISWAHGDLHRIVGYRYAYPQVFEEFQLDPETANEALVETGIKELTRCLERLEKRYLSTAKYLQGDSLTLADAVVATVLVQAEWMGFSFRLWPRVARWMQAVSQQDYWAEVHAEHGAFVSRLRSGILYPSSDMGIDSESGVSKPVSK